MARDLQPGWVKIQYRYPKERWASKAPLSLCLGGLTLRFP